MRCGILVELNKFYEDLLRNDSLFATKFIIDNKRELNWAERLRNFESNDADGVGVGVGVKADCLKKDLDL